MENNQFAPKPVFILFLCGIVAIFISILIPSRTTIVAIAASEYGEKMINSREAQDLKNPAMDLIKQWIKKESDKMTKSESK